MTGEFDAVSQAEAILGSGEDKQYTVQIPGMVLVELTLHLDGMRAIRSMSLGVSELKESDEEILTVLQTRFKRRVLSEPAPVVEQDISRREMDALGESLPKIKRMVKLRKRLAPELATQFDEGFYGMAVDSFRKLNEAFVFAGGADNQDLLQRLDRRR